MHDKFQNSSKHVVPISKPIVYCLLCIFYIVSICLLGVHFVPIGWHINKHSSNLYLHRYCFIDIGWRGIHIIPTGWLGIHIVRVADPDSVGSGVFARIRIRNKKKIAERSLKVIFQKKT